MYKVSVPGSLMLMGEHAVLHGHPALVASINQRMTVTLLPTTNPNISITSDGFDKESFDKNYLPSEGQFKFIYAAIKTFQSMIPNGFELKIQSEFASDLGFGSSSAVTVGTIAVIVKWLQSLNILTVDAEEYLSFIYKTALSVIQEVQGRGSGADVAASVYGGVVDYQLNPNVVNKLPTTLDLTVVYLGWKVPTPEVIRLVDKKREVEPTLVNQLFHKMSDLTEQAKAALVQKDWPTLGQCLTKQSHCFVDLELSTHKIEELLTRLKNQVGILGAKLSGSGLGDCLIGLGQMETPLDLTGFPNAKVIPISLDTQGIIYE